MSKLPVDFRAAKALAAGLWSRLLARPCISTLRCRPYEEQAMWRRSAKIDENIPKELREFEVGGRSEKGYASEEKSEKLKCKYLSFHGQKFIFSNENVLGQGRISRNFTFATAQHHRFDEVSEISDGRLMRPASYARYNCHVGEMDTKFA